MKPYPKSIVLMVACGVLMAGCAQQQQQHGKYMAAPAPTSPPAEEPAPVEKAGTVSAYFPSGRAKGSGLLVEKSAPAQVLAGAPFEYTYTVSNLTETTLENVRISDRVTSNFTATEADPKATSHDGNIATWDLGSLDPEASKTITVKGVSPDEGAVTTCGWASYTPVACQDIQVVKAHITLTKTEPADMVICDPLPVTLTVKNSGSSALTDVQIQDNLPDGLTSDGKSNLSFDADNLAPGETKEFKYDANASVTGKLMNTAKVTTAEGVSAEASASTMVHQPVLAITCSAPDRQYMGRKFNVSYTVSNTGDTPSTGTKLEVKVPQGLTVASTADGGQANEGEIVWDLGSVDTGSPKTVTATFTSAEAGTFSFAGNVKGDCATEVSTSCETKVIGVAAILLEKADDPDPVAIGDTTTYTVKVTNQGSANDYDVHVVVTVDKELVPIKASAGTISGQVVDLPVVPTLAPKAAVTYTIVAKGVQAGGAVTQFKLSSDLLSQPITAEESTTVY